MSRIDRIFAELRSRGGRGVMPFVCGGYPGAGAVAETLPALQRAGAAVVEIGIPFSDPIADGPVIAAAMHEALQAGTTPTAVFEEVASVRARVEIGIVAMCSVSIVQRMGGAQRFTDLAAQAGFDGLIVPDAPLEESAGLLEACRRRDLSCSLLVAPTTPPQRAAEIARACTGFVYVVARTGITGERADAPRVERVVAPVRRATTTPIACGFGISAPEHVATVVAHAEAAIVGSALVRRMGEAGGVAEAAREAERWVGELVRAAGG